MKKTQNLFLFITSQPAMTENMYNLNSTLLTHVTIFLKRFYSKRNILLIWTNRTFFLPKTFEISYFPSKVEKVKAQKSNGKYYFSKTNQKIQNEQKHASCKGPFRPIYTTYIYSICWMVFRIVKPYSPSVIINMQFLNLSWITLTGPYCPRSSLCGVY